MYAPPAAVYPAPSGSLYPALSSYMGMEITPAMMENMQVAVVNQSQVSFELAFFSLRLACFLFFVFVVCFTELLLA